MAATIRPSARGELEITDLNRLYLEDGSAARREAVARLRLAGRRHAGQPAAGGDLRADHPVAHRHAGRLPGGGGVPHGLYRRRSRCAAQARRAGQDRTRPGAAELAEGSCAHERRAPRHPRCDTAHARRAIGDRARLLLRDLEREAVRRGRHPRTVRAGQPQPVGAARRGARAASAGRAERAGQAGALRARRDLGRGGGCAARLADLRAARRGGAERGELAPVVGAAAASCTGSARSSRTPR